MPSPRLLSSLALAALCAAAPLAQALPPAPAAVPIAEALNNQLAPLLARFADAEGQVDYAGLKRDRTGLDSWVLALGTVAPAELAALPEAERLAFWLNAYNGLTLRVVVDHHPIASRLLTRLVYPENSIRQVKGAWDGIRFDVAGTPRTLEEIEHGILRKDFHEPRIHVALVCAARSCPRLRAEPYRGAVLSAQLDDQARRFVANPRAVRFGGDRRSVELSAIFNWFGEDFAAAAGPGVTKEAAVLAFVAKHLPEQAAVLRQNGLRVTFLDYDWSLNEQPATASP